jgi:hypothetical protein
MDVLGKLQNVPGWPKSRCVIPQSTLNDYTNVFVRVKPEHREELLEVGHTLFDALPKPCYAPYIALLERVGLGREAFWLEERGSWRAETSTHPQ